jgi:hypothetical protein
MLYPCTICAVNQSFNRETPRLEPPFLDDARWRGQLGSSTKGDIGCATIAGCARVISLPATVMVTVVAPATAAAATADTEAGAERSTSNVAAG